MKEKEWRRGRQNEKMNERKKEKKKTWNKGRRKIRTERNEEKI